MSTFEITVVVPTLRRPDQLLECLAGLAAQGLAPREVVVVVRSDDEATISALTATPLEVIVVEVEVPGVLAAMEAGLDQASSSWVAFCDDDAVPRADWLERMAMLAGPEVVGIGGRDVLHNPDGSLRPTTLSADVGRVTPWGRLIGNHHRGEGGPRAVEVLKGANCAYRREVLRLPQGLRGSGAQVHFEVAVGMRLARMGSLVYDPAIIVDHRPADRFDDDRRGEPTPGATAAAAYNLEVAVGVRSRWSALRRALYVAVLGDRSCPGVLRALAALLDRRDAHTTARLLPSLRGTTQGLWAVLRGRGVSFDES